MLMKTRVRNEQTRCRVACGEQSFVLEGSSLAGSNVYYTFALFLFFKKKEKHTVFEDFSFLGQNIENFYEREICRTPNRLR